MICVLCQRSEVEPDHGRAHPGCVLRVRLALVELGEAYAAISAPEVIGDPAAVRVLDDGEWEPRLAIALTELPAGTTRSAGSAPISGSREAPVPVSLDRVDLTAHARGGAVRDAMVPLMRTRQVEIVEHRVEIQTREHEERDANGERVRVRERVPVTVTETQRRMERYAVELGGELVMVPAGDQVGAVPVATVLDSWVRDWRETRAMGESLPVPTVPTLVGWLAARVDWAAQHHDAIDEFADEIRLTLWACRRVVGDVPTHPELLDGVPCQCDAVGTLYRDHASQWAAECGSCGRMYSAEEYAAWVGSLTAEGVEAA